VILFACELLYRPSKEKFLSVYIYVNKLPLLEKSRHDALMSFRNYVIGFSKKYFKPSALIHVYDDENIFVILKSLDQELYVHANI
jgi:hypothetical protein